MSLQGLTSYTLQFLRYSPDKLFPAAHPDTMGENNTLTALKGCGVKMQHIFENIGYFRCVGEVSALNIDVFKNSSFTCADRCYP